MRLLLLFTITIVLVALSLAEQDSEVSLQRAAREAGTQSKTRRRKHKKKKNQRRKNQKNKDNKRTRGRKQRPKKKQARQGIVIKGNNCEYIFLADITSNSGCTTGNKFVLKGATGVRKQFLILNSKATLAFVTKGAKFTACTTFTDITTTVKCKEVADLASVDLGSSGSADATTAAAAATTAAAGATTAAAGATTAPAGATTAAAGATTASGSVRFGSGPLDHWPLVEDVAKCRNDHCSKESAACLADTACNGLMNCFGACYTLDPSEDINICLIECERAMALNEGVVDLIRCWGEHHCQESRPEYGGSCRATHAREGSQKINNLGKVEGVWWTVMAWECGSGIYYTAGADTSPCLISKHNGCSTMSCLHVKKGGSVIQIKENSQFSLLGPGVLRTTNTDMKPYPFSAYESHIVDYNDSYQLQIWCGGYQNATFNGALVVSRNRTIDLLPQETLDRFKANVAARGYDSEDFCTFDNTECDECTN